MKIFYFTATGNSLDVAKHLEGELFSIPKILKNDKYEFEDNDSIGLVFPCHSFYMPHMVEEFLEKVQLKSPYLFAIITYGSITGNAENAFRKHAYENGLSFDYINSLKMVDNYLPVFDVEKQVAMNRKTDEKRKEIIAQIQSKKKRIPQDNIFSVLFSGVIRPALHLFPANHKRFRISEACNRCQTCARVCPRDNIVVKDLPEYGKNCDFCLACIHVCPQKAITLKREANADARYRNPNVSVREIIDSND